MPNSLLDAIELVMRGDDAERLWGADDMLSALVDRRWEPKGKTPRNSVDASFSRLLKQGSEWNVSRLGAIAFPPEPAGKPNGRR